MAIPAGHGEPGKGRATVTSARAHTYEVRDSVFRTPHRRRITVDDAASRITVGDTFRARSWRQMWHLDPKWTLLRSGTQRLEFAHPTGRRLVVFTTGRVTSVMHGATGPLRGWHAPRFGVREPAPEITVAERGGACITTFTVL